MNSSNSHSAACLNSVSLVLGHIVVDCLMGSERRSPKAQVQCANHQRT